MRNLLVEMAYNGKNYHGYQVQANAITITQVVQEAIYKVIGVREDIVGCSRTDKGVHANSYFFNMKTCVPIDCDKFKNYLNSYLPKDIVILNIKNVSPQLHSRYQLRGKEYLYKIYNRELFNPFLDGLEYHYKKPIDVCLLNEVSKSYIGKHDFLGFTNAKVFRSETVRNIFEASCYKENDTVIFKVFGDGFLYNMVRIMAGALLAVNDRRISVEDLHYMLKNKEKNNKVTTLPGSGLYLNRVEFLEHIKEDFIDNFN